MAQFFFGYSAWWGLIIGLRVWLGQLALWLRRDTSVSVAGSAPHPAQMGHHFPRWRFWLGVLLLITASCALEWSRLYRNELSLAGEHAGGIVGLYLGQQGGKWLGFNGSGVLWIAMLVAGTSMACDFPGWKWLSALASWWIACVSAVRLSAKLSKTSRLVSKP